MSADCVVSCQETAVITVPRKTQPVASLICTLPLNPPWLSITLSEKFAVGAPPGNWLTWPPPVTFWPPDADWLPGGGFPWPPMHVDTFDAVTPPLNWNVGLKKSNRIGRTCTSKWVSVQPTVKVSVSVPPVPVEQPTLVPTGGVPLNTQRSK